MTSTVYGRVFSGQQTVPAGSYLSTFSGTDAEIKFGAVGDSCNTLSSTATTTSNVTATVPTTCTIATNNLSFGTTGVLTANTDATTTVAPDCTNGTPYNIGLDGGLSGATDPTQRKMKKAAEVVLYGLYRDSARSLPFGNTIGTNTLAGTGTGLAQSVTVYGRIAPQATPSPGDHFIFPSRSVKVLERSASSHLGAAILSEQAAGRVRLWTLSGCAGCTGFQAG